MKNVAVGLSYCSGVSPLVDQEKIKAGDIPEIEDSLAPHAGRLLVDYG